MLFVFHPISRAAFAQESVLMYIEIKCICINKCQNLCREKVILSQKQTVEQIFTEQKTKQKMFQGTL